MHLTRVAGLVALLAVLTPCGSAKCRFAAGADGRVLTYTFRASVSSSGAGLHVTLAFRGGPQGMETIAVPTEWAGEKLHGVTNLRALSRDTVLEKGDAGGNRVVHYRPHRPVILAYDLVKDWTGAFRYPLQFHAVLMPEYLEVTGSNALVHPELSRDAAITVHLDWRRIPDGWVLATSFGTSAGAAGRCQSYAGRWSDVEDALFAAGEFRLHHFLIRSRPAVLAVRGQWTFSDDEVIRDIQQIVGMERAFFHDDNFPYFLFTLKPFDTERGSGDGSAFTNAFWLYMSRLDGFSGQLTQIAHEAFHAWNPARMGRLTENSETIDWFKEGFTQYYAYLLVWRAGLLPLPDYIASINRDLRDYPVSSNPYVRGRVIALWLDGQMRRDSNREKALDDVMRGMVNGARQPLSEARKTGRPAPLHVAAPVLPGGAGNAPLFALSEARILEAAERYLSPPDRNQLEAAVKSRGGLAAPAGVLGPCVRSSIDEVVSFDAGFAVSASTDARRVMGVRPEGPAFRAGLRDGQELLGWSIYNDQPDKMAKFTIRTAAGRQTIEYYPRGETRTVPQYHLDEQAYQADPAACRVE
ncbi:MAG TPA: hypothetical protein VMI94_18290 [Bryobacteraceae bacterium]|nr:hypothetical protein [Bryobacteraceae bacterium]